MGLSWRASAVGKAECLEACVMPGCTDLVNVRPWLIQVPFLLS